jgi:peptide/nickel transport system substrate-binding protein
MAAFATVGAATCLLAACGSSGGGGTQSAPAGGSTTTAPSQITSDKGTPTQGGTATFAESADATPNYIFPMASLDYFSTTNLSQFQPLMYRPLYWFGDSNQPVVDFDKSIGQKPVFSDNDTVASVTLNNYTWSNGEKVTARDVEFWMNMLKAEKANWAGYVPGLFPDNVKSVTGTGSTVVFHLTKTYNPTWFLYNELSQITPMPMAWDKTSLTGATPSVTSTTAPDLTPSGAKAVYTFLSAQSTKLTTYTSSPLWTVVDGPWKLVTFNSQGTADFVDNPKYTGADKPHLAKFNELPFTSDDAEFNTLKTGGLTVGSIPPQDIDQKSSVESSGYSAAEAPLYDFNYMAINFNNPTVGPLFHQLYIRQALQHLVNQPGWIKAFDAGLAAPTYGPVPVTPPNKFADKVEQSNPYPYSVSDAVSLLSSHGWKINKGGTDTCAKPGTAADECGAGIPAGKAMSFNLEFANGTISFTNSMDNYQQVAKEAGVTMNLKAVPFDTAYGKAVVCKSTQSTCSWEINNWGGGWVYSPDFYASGESLYQTGAGSNSGSYSDPTADKLIAKTTTIGASGSQSALDAYQNYIAKQIPVIFEPEAQAEAAVSSKLHGYSNNVYDYVDPEDWFYTKS